LVAATPLAKARSNRSPSPTIGPAKPALRTALTNAAPSASFPLKNTASALLPAMVVASVAKL
jgi:hypothetical protein